MVRCSVFSDACSFAWVNRSRMEGISSRLIFPAGKLLKCRCDGIRIPAFEKDQVTGLLCGGVFLQGKIHMVFLRHMGESLDILVTDLDIGKTCVLAGKLFKALPAAVDFLASGFSGFPPGTF